MANASFYILGDDMPPAAHAFLVAQPDHYDANSEAGSAQSAYFEVLGKPYKDKDGYERLHVAKILRMKPADTAFLASYGQRPVDSKDRRTGL